MLHKYIVAFSIPPNVPSRPDWGFFLHGLLMSRLPFDTATHLHEEKVRPYAQHWEATPEGLGFWYIGVWNDHIAKQIAQAISTLDTVTLTTKGKQLTLRIKEITCKKQDMDSMFSCIGGKYTIPSRYVMDFVTPTAHKRDHQYVMLPDPFLIWHSLALRHAAFIPNSPYGNSEIVHALAAHTRIESYNLRSAEYSLKGTAWAESQAAECWIM